MRLQPWMLLILFLSPWAANGEVVVIVHPQVAVDTLKHQQIMDIYAGELTFWHDNSPVAVCDLKPKSPTKLAFYGYLGKTTSQMKSLWMKKLLLGEGAPPTMMLTEQQVVDFVADTPGAIGYVDARYLDDRVKQLAVITATD